MVVFGSAAIIRSYQAWLTGLLLSRLTMLLGPAPLLLVQVAPPLPDRITAWMSPLKLLPATAQMIWLAFTSWTGSDNRQR